MRSVAAVASKKIPVQIHISGTTQREKRAGRRFYCPQATPNHPPIGVNPEPLALGGLGCKAALGTGVCATGDQNKPRMGADAGLERPPAAAVSPRRLWAAQTELEPSREQNQSRSLRSVRLCLWGSRIPPAFSPARVNPASHPPIE